MINNKEILMILEEEYDGKDEWRADLCDYDDNWLFVDAATNNILAEATVLDDFSYMKVDCFEVKRGLRNVGVGRECIKLLMDYSISLGKKGLSGDATQEGTGFWHRIGADIILPNECNSCNEECDSCEHYDVDDLNEFVLKIRPFYSYYETRNNKTKELC